MDNLDLIINKAKSGQLPKGFIYLPDNYEWNLNSPCVIANIDDASIFKSSGLTYTFASWFISEIIEKASAIQKPLLNETIVKAMIYYLEYEVFLPDLEATPPIEIQIDEDLLFYDSLGLERIEVNCKNLYCKRGAIKGSAFCRTHHFEMVLKKACRFQH